MSDGVILMGRRLQRVWRRTKFILGTLVMACAALGPGHPVKAGNACADVTDPGGCPFEAVEEFTRCEPIQISGGLYGTQGRLAPSTCELNRRGSDNFAFFNNPVRTGTPNANCIVEIDSCC